MNKKNYAVALLILMISVVFIPAEKREAGKRTITTAAPSETTSIEYTTDESGEKIHNKHKRRAYSRNHRQGRFG